MTTLVSIGLANAVAATVLAIIAAAAGRLSKRPALAHSLWLLVLIKLVTPPLFHLPVASLPAPELAAAEVPAPAPPAPFAGLPVPAGEVFLSPPDPDLAGPPALAPFTVAVAPELPPELRQALLPNAPEQEEPELAGPPEGVAIGFVTPASPLPAAEPAAPPSEGSVALWDTISMRERTVLQGPRGVIYSVAFAPDGKALASAGQDETVRLWAIPMERPAAARER